MNSYPQKSMPLTDLLGHSYSSFIKQLYYLVPLALTLTIVCALGSWLPKSLPLIIDLLVYLVLWCIFSYAWSYAVVGSHLSLRYSNWRPSKTFRCLNSKISLLYLVSFCFIALELLLAVIGFYLGKWIGGYFNHSLQALLQLLIASILFAAGMIAFLPSFALSLLLSKNLWQVFQDSLYLSGAKNFFRLISMYVVVVFVYIITIAPSRHAVWLEAHHVKYLFDFCFLVLTGPLLSRFFVLLVNDLALRLRVAKLALSHSNEHAN